MVESKVEFISHGSAVALQGPTVPLSLHEILVFLYKFSLSLHIISLSLYKVSLSLHNFPSTRLDFPSTSTIRLVLPGKLPVMAPTISRFGQKRKPESEAGGPPKAMSFAERMMLKMGHQPGQGLGENGEGIVEPIEVKQRPQGAGLGTIREKTEQAKSEAKRAAARRGEEYQDSSDEERQAKRQRREAARSSASNGTRTPISQPRTRYRMDASVQSLVNDVGEANVLKSIVDATGPKTRILTSTAGLMTPNGNGTAFTTTEKEKIAARARRDLEVFATTWSQLQERKEYVSRRQEDIQREIIAQDNDINELKDVIKIAEQLQEVKLDSHVEDDQLNNRWSQLVGQLEAIQTDFPDGSSLTMLQEVAVTALNPFFKRCMDFWNPLSTPDYLVADLKRLRIILGINSEESSVNQNDDDFDEHKTQTSSSLYETMMSSSWLRKMRGVITNEWEVEDSERLLRVVEAWKPVLPAFVFHRLVDVLIADKLSSALRNWDPRSDRKRKLPHIWLFPWLQHLDDSHLDHSSADGLLAEVKNKLKIALKGWDISKGVMPGLENWRKPLGGELDKILWKNLLPRLRHLLKSFTVDPSDQDLSSLEQVMAWKGYLKPSVMAQFLTSEYFPKWLNALHQWLSLPDPGARFDEVGDWFEWWDDYMPSEIKATATVQQEFQKALEMMNMAMDLYEASESLLNLPPPPAGPSRPIAPNPMSSAVHNGQPDAQTKARREVQEATFKDVVEDWCGEEGLFLIPLRKAEETSGQPLFRMTASASGKGGILVYLKGDVIWGQNKKVWEPLGIEPRGFPQPLLELAGLK